MQNLQLGIVMTMREEDGFDPELAEKLSIICFDECCGCPSDIGIVLAIACREHGEVKLLDEDMLNELQGRKREVPEG